MFIVRIIAVVTVWSFLLNENSAAARTTNLNSVTQTQKTAKPASKDNPQSEMKVLAAGAHCTGSNSFIAVARDPDTYAAISRLAGDMPKLDDAFFKSNVVIAAFLGQRRTGGYSVEFTRSDDGQLLVREKAPGKNAMVIQVLTTPFKVVSVPIMEDSPLRVELDVAWRERMRAYRVIAGQFTISGGFAGRSEKFQLNGNIGVVREGTLATFALSLSNISATKERSLTDLATGIMDDSAFKLRKLSKGSLVDPPSSSLRGDGKFSDKESKLSMTFTSLPSMVADGYAGQGTIEAEAVGSAEKSKSLL